MTYYIVLPYNDNEIVDDLIAFSKERWLAMSYAKEWDCYDISIVEYDTNNVDDMFKYITTEFKVHISPYYEIEQYKLSSKPPEQYYLYTDSQYTSLYEYSPIVTEEYLEEILYSIYWTNVLCDYLSEPLKVKLQTIVSYMLYKYIIRVILFTKTDISEFQDFIEKSGMVSTGNLTKINDNYCVTDDDVLNMGMIIKLCMNQYKPQGD